MVCGPKGKGFKICQCTCRWRCKCVLPRERKPHPPFNIGVKSRVQLNSHSAHETPPIGSYEIPPIVKKCLVTSWKRKEEMEEFSATQGGRFLDKFGIIQKKKNNIGPGSYDVDQWPENVLKKTGANVKEDFGFGTTSRFIRKQKFTTPGPGYTGKDHNPYYYIEQKRKKGLSPLPTFEYDGLAPRIKKGKTFSLPPNRYQVKHPDCLDSILKKVTGKRGPYDLFSGPRDDSSITGYFASPETFIHPDWPQIFPGEIEMFFHKSNHFKGTFTNCPRFPKKPTLRIMQNDLSLCYKDPSHPGPGHYDPKFSESPKNFINYPFGTSVEKDRPLRPKEVRPGPGRYDPKIEKKINGSGWTSVFKSKLPRTRNLVKESYNNF